jgi:hypothetical protein
MCPTAEAQHWQHVEVVVVGFLMFYSGLISTVVFDTLKIPAGCISPTCNPLATGLLKTILFVAITSTSVVFKRPGKSRASGNPAVSYDKECFTLSHLSYFLPRTALLQFLSR